MDQKLYRLNALYAIVDTFIALFGIASFGFAAWFFGKWWLVLFTIIPLFLFSNHSLVINSDLAAASEAEKEVKKDGRELADR